MLSHKLTLELNPHHLVRLTFLEYTDTFSPHQANMIFTTSSQGISSFISWVSCFSVNRWHAQYWFVEKFGFGFQKYCCIHFTKISSSPATLKQALMYLKTVPRNVFWWIILVIYSNLVLNYDIVCTFWDTKNCIVCIFKNL